MTKLIKSKERVSEHGEVFTPEHIVLEMISLIDDAVWADKEYVCLEPTCGNGNFVVEVVKKKLSCGLSIFQATNTTFGMDIMEDNIFECRERLLRICLEHESDSSKLFRLSCIIVNNIFQVEDSLTYIQNKDWENKKFFDEDLTETVADKGLNKFLKKTKNKQILSISEQEKIKKQTKSFLKKVNS